MRWKGFTLLELVTVIMVVGILAAIALPNFTPMREKALDKEAQASLKLVLAAQKIYRMENTFYFPDASLGHAPTNGEINSFLKLDVPTTAQRAWDYTCKASPCAQATRTGDDNRVRHMLPADTDLQNNACP